MAEHSFRCGVDNTPHSLCWMFYQLKFMPGRMNVNFIWRQFQTVVFVFVFPAYRTFLHIYIGVLRNINHIRIFFIDGEVSFLYLDAVAQQLFRFIERIRLVELFGEIGSKNTVAHISARESNGATGMFFFNQTIKVGRIADLCFYLFFGIPVIIIGNKRNHHPAFIATG